MGRAGREKPDSISTQKGRTMHALVLLWASATVGIDAGWVPLEGGGHEYTVQIEPELLKVLERGNDLVSEVPPEITVRRYRITATPGTLQREYGTEPRSNPPRRDHVDEPKSSYSDPPQRADEPATPPRNFRIESDDAGRN